VDLGGSILGKPGTPEAAVAQLERMAGRKHRIVTGVCLRRPDGAHDHHADVHVMTMRQLGRAALAAYVAAENPVDCAGSYKIESGGLLLFEAIEGRDHTGVIGLPLLAVAGMLAAAGFRVPPGL
jgi:septum formation protein